jgi:hypothetical protein
VIRCGRTCIVPPRQTITAEWVPMADDSTAYVIPLHQVPPKRKKTAPRGARVNRKARQTAKAALAAEAEPSAFESLIPPDFLAANDRTADDAQQLKPIIRQVAPVVPLRRKLASILLAVAAFALAVVGIAINGWFARSLGANDVAGWLFLTIGVAADVAALVLPCCAAELWQAGQRANATLGWVIWLVTFTFAVTAGIGFTSTNISDVALARASRVTPAVATAQAALADAMAARDRECKGGVGKFCREREAAVAERRQMLDTAMGSVLQAADPQTDAAIKLVTWVSRGMLQPAGDDFAMLRLVLLALLPQMGGILLLIGRRSAKAA